MKAGDLKKLLGPLPDDMEVVFSGSDHSFLKVGMRTKVLKAEKDSEYGDHYEYWDEDSKRNPNNSVVDVLWIDNG
ncbi:MAG TPA: hypothetical protein VII94_00340 [Candidatus Saccharimonadales bacterium]